MRTHLKQWINIVAGCSLLAFAASASASEYYTSWSADVTFAEALPHSFAAGQHTGTFNVAVPVGSITDHGQLHTYSKTLIHRFYVNFTGGALGASPYNLDSAGSLGLLTADKSFTHGFTSANLQSPFQVTSVRAYGSHVYEVPEPETWALAIAGLVLVGGLKRLHTR